MNLPISVFQVGLWRFIRRYIDCRIYIPMAAKEGRRYILFYTCKKIFQFTFHNLKRMENAHAALEQISECIEAKGSSIRKQQLGGP